MEKNVLSYFLKANLKASKVFSKSILSYFKYLIYFISNLITSASIILFPIASLTNFDLTNEVIDNNSFEIDKIFKNVSNQKKVINLFLLYLTNILVLGVGGLIIGYSGYYFIELGVLIDETTTLPLYLFAIIFSVQTGVLSLIFLVKIQSKFQFAYYLVNKEDLTIGEALSRSKKAIKAKQEIKMVILLLLNVIFIAIIVYSYMYLLMLMDGQYDEINHLFLMIILTTIVLVLLIRRILTFKVSFVLYFEDICKNEVESIYVSSSQINNKDLINLFEVTKEEL